MALPTTKMPRVFLEDENGDFYEIRVTEIHSYLEDDHGLRAHRLSIEGMLVHSSPTGPTRISPIEMNRMIFGDRMNIGGIPPDVVLQCAICKFHDSASTHTCR